MDSFDRNRVFTTPTDCSTFAISVSSNSFLSSSMNSRLFIQDTSPTSLIMLSSMENILRSMGISENTVRVSKRLWLSSTFFSFGLFVSSNAASLLVSKLLCKDNSCNSGSSSFERIYAASEPILQPSMASSSSLGTLNYAINRALPIVMGTFPADRIIVYGASASSGCSNSFWKAAWSLKGRAGYWTSQESKAWTGSRNQVSSLIYRQTSSQPGSKSWDLEDYIEKARENRVFNQPCSFLLQRSRTQIEGL